MNLFKDIKGFINNQFSIGLKDTKVEIRNNNGILEFKNKDNDFKPFTALSNWKENQLYTQDIDIVLHDNKLYRCITTHTSGISFNPSYWTLLNDLSASPIQPWNSNTSYLETNIVLFGNDLFRCIVSHTSGTSFDSTKWTKLGTSNGGGLLRIDYPKNDASRTTNQTVFEVPNHIVNNQSLIVMVEGLTMSLGKDYNDIDSTHVEFLSDIEPTESVSVILIDIASMTGSSIDDSIIENDKTWSSSKLDIKFNDIQTVLDNLTYVSPTVSISNNVNTVEKGSTVNNVTLNWTTNKAITSQSITGIGAISDVNLRTYNLTGLGLTSNKSWTITINDGKNNATNSTGISFINGRYYGVSSSTTYDNSLITSLTKELVENKSKTFTLTSNSGQYIYYAIPSRLGTCSFSVGGFSGGFDKVATINYTNPSGYSENYDIYKSTNANLGNTTVVVS